MSNPLVDAAKRLKEAATDYFLAQDNADRTTPPPAADQKPPATPPPSPTAPTPAAPCSHSHDAPPALQKEVGELRLAMKVALDQLQALRQEREAQEKQARAKTIERLMAHNKSLPRDQLDAMDQRGLDMLARLSGIQVDNSLRETPAQDKPGTSTGMVGPQGFTAGYYDHQKKEWVT